MDKTTIKALIQWLETASDQEIIERQDIALGLLRQLKTREVLADTRLILRLIDEELVSRQELRRFAERG